MEVSGKTELLPIRSLAEVAGFAIPDSAVQPAASNAILKAA